MNIKGGGVTFYKDSQSDEMQLFNGGMRAMPSGQMRMELGRDLTDNHHEVMEYERGTILHSRAPHTRFIDFHYLYGGPYKFFIKRHLYQGFYKRYLRQVWAVGTLFFAFQCIGTRMYDNKVYDYYYFSD